MRVLFLVLIGVLSGCSTIEKVAELQNPKPPEGYKQYQPESAQDTMHAHVELLARQLLDTTNSFDPTRPVAVGTFLPANSLKQDKNKSHRGIGLQLQESMMTFLTQAGLKVIEFKVKKSMSVAAEYDQFVSRAVTDLDPAVRADYILVGNYTQQQDNLMVNVRLIDVGSKTIVAAATDYLPLTAMWSHEKVKLKNDQLIRGEY
ncbi:hypothetical protein J1N51_05900 [Psychrosphaera ytuae]|uniref:FlgO domain-containing protein n=1 Tax=Psychrosphaera ytuae TaxID=2820710 RepID=A0A975HJ60_9GAMM|nr:FlgO family outer membrane protein [Psychrosphaera ytuae]QTH64980.1 hypothetical protein J1N51_05900 [Psychrosphaera ytuae]